MFRVFTANGYVHSTGFLFFAELCLGGYGPKHTICNSQRRHPVPTTPRHRRAHQGAFTHPLSSHFVSNEWLSFSVTRPTRPSRPASSRCPPIADASIHRRDCSQASACCSFFSIRSLFQWSFSFFSPSDVRLQARTEICRFPRLSFLTRSGSRPRLLSSFSSPLWAAPAPSAFPARSGAQPLPASHQARSGVRRSCGPPTCLARVSSRGPLLRDRQPSGSVPLSSFSSSPSPPRCSRLPHDVSIVLERPLNSAGATT